LEEDEAETIVHGVTHLQMVGAMCAERRRKPRLMTIASPLVEEMQVNLTARHGVRAAVKRLLAMQLFRRIESHVLRKSDTIHVMSDYCAGLLSQWYGQDWQRKRFQAAGWADERFQPLEQSAARTQLNWPHEARIVVCVRRLEPRMGIDRAIEAIDLLKQRGQRVRLYIAGRGSLRESLQQQVEQRGLLGQICFLGYVADEMLPALYSAADVSLVPTTALECFGLTVIESHACGTPAITTPIGSLPELYGDQFPQWVAEDSTGPAIAACLARFFADEPRPAADQLAGITRRRYDKEVILDRFEAEYQRLTTLHRDAKCRVAASVTP
jgi:glycosyltransferase involved in cell wall biosynthesis